MGFALTLLYLGTTYLGVETVFGPLAAFHLEVIIALLIILVSLPSITQSFLLKTPQALALAGLAIAVFVSVALTGWLGGAVAAFQAFIPSAFAYFLICLHCNTKRRLQIIVLMLMSVCIFVTVRGIIDLRAVKIRNDHNQRPGSISDYLVGQRNDSDVWIYRIRGQNVINDPNDFAQFIVTVIPLTFIFWQRKKIVRNLFLVILPVSFMFYGAFLTHSRGFLLAFLAVLTMAGRRRIGTIPSLIIAATLFAGATVSNFTGGREISADAGSGRMALWGGGLGLLKSHPLFGVGYGRLSEYLGLTAHNSVVACAAELGLFGLYCWCLFLTPSLRNIYILASPGNVTEGESNQPEQAPLSWRPAEPFKKPVIQKLDKTELNRLGELALLSFTGFLTAGFFLSRGLVLTFFLLGGITEVLYQMALHHKMVSARMKFGRVLMYSGIVSVSLLAVIEVIIRVAMPR